MATTLPLIERMRTQLHVWEDEEPTEDWWTYQREYAEAFHLIEKMTRLVQDCEESFTADDSYVLLRSACRTLLSEARAEQVSA